MSEAKTFIIDCPWCKAKVAASEHGRVTKTGVDEISDPWGHTVAIGECPRCNSVLVGESHQLAFAEYDSDEDRWSDTVRVYPKPPKTFASWRIPKVAISSIEEADRSLQVNANIAACVMMGRALEAVCRDVLAEKDPDKKPSKPIMLGSGIKQLKEKGIIDDRLFDWSQQLHAFRNLAAHPEDVSISRQDAEDLQTFVYAIIEYIYDLSDRYEEFKDRAERKAKKKKQ